MNRCVILGGGPSLNKTNLSAIYNEYVIGTNFAFTLGNFVDCMIFGDCRLYQKWGHEELIDNFCGKKYTLCASLKDDPKFIYYEKCPKHFLCQEKGKLGWRTSHGPNTGSAAINLAVQLGYTQIILLGYDGKVKQNKHNFHNYHDHTPQPPIYFKFNKHFSGLAKDLEELDVEVINCTPNSALKMFKIAKLEDICTM